MLKDLRPALRAFLLADTGIAAAVGGKRIFPSVMPQGVRSTSLVYTIVSGIGDHHMQGASGLMMNRMQITAWSETLDGAAALALLVQERLDGYRGPMTSTAGTVKVQGVFYETDNPHQFDDVRSLHAIGRDYMVHFAQR